jgi:3-oxoacyl-[acyl-carrier-protein] synthase III
VIYVNAISFHLPQETLSNEAIISEYKEYGGLNETITPSTLYAQCGVKNRHICSFDDTTKDLGNKAAEALFEEWNIDKSTIDYIIFVSDALEYKGPTTACIMQHNLGLNQGIGAIDILHGCTGWVYGLSLAKALIVSQQASNVLLVTAETPTKVIHPIDTELRALFSDGAAATLVSDNTLKNGLNGSINNFILGTDGSGEKHLWTERSATREPADIEWLTQYKDLPTKLLWGRLRMKSSKIFLFALRKVPALIQQVLEKNDLEKEAIDFYVLHQANGTMLEFLRKKMKIPQEKFIITIEDTGNTVSSSIPLAMKNCMDRNVFKKGNTILVAGFGIGYSWGGTILKL